MAIFVEEELPLFDYRTARQVEDSFRQKPARLPLELPLQPVVVQTPSRSDLPTIIIGALAIIGLVGLFLAYFTTRRKT